MSAIRKGDLAMSTPPGSRSTFVVPAMFVRPECVIRLTTSGARVSLIIGPPPAGSLTKYEEIGTIRWWEGIDAHGLADSLESCRIGLRNQAASRGADLVVSEPLRVGYVCGEGDHEHGNCALLAGRAYRRR